MQKTFLCILQMYKKCFYVFCLQMNVFNIYGFIRLDSDIHIHEINSETIAAFTDH